MENIKHNMESVLTEALRIIDPKAAERAKRYIWSRIERNDTSRRPGK